MFRITSSCSFRFREKASVFLTELHPAGDPESRAAVLAQLRKRDFDANHHCSAWRQGVPVAGQGCDDDGEPSGTAGGPMLRVLEGEQLTDVLAVCIRWFGGTKLGTGGLVRAYTEGVQGAVAEARAGGLLQEVRILRIGRISVPAELAHLPYAALGAFPEAEIAGQDFTEQGVVVTFRMPPGREAQLEALWQERSRGGRIHWE
ncbi:YigZ family protein [uncultured Tolumonas sp.]|uniref:IMPACT family protein n=1 Tax=uncultured Tolumonas sp. TaxID=263765 RepID=UPI00292D36CB|nr:YigZ family protein [uncultured Tolumonas sp.]